MNYFGELLRKYIDKSGYTIYSISYQSKLNRTTLQKAISGDRLLSIENMQKIMPYLKLTPHEKADFEKAFLISHLGKETYKKHMLIKSITSNEKKRCLKSPPFFSSPQPLTIEKSTEVEGMHNILSILFRLIYTCIENSDKPFFHAVSNFNTEFFPALYSRFDTENFKNLNVIHTIPFIKNTFENNELTQHNMKQLSAILPFTTVPSSCVTFYYYYEQNDISMFSSFPYSVYLITNYNTVLLSSDYQHALILPQECNDYFESTFSDILKNSHLLFDNAPSVEKYLSATEEISKVQIAHIIEQQPCIFRFIDVHTPINLLNDANLSSEQINNFLHLTNLRHKHLMHLEQCFSYVSFDGYVDFVENGVLYELPQNMTRPFSVQERLLILNRILEANEQGNFHTLLLKKEAYSPQTNVVIYDYSSLFFYQQDCHKQYHLCKIYESGVITEFCDFFEHLERHNLSYTTEETNDILKQTIAHLEKEYSKKK